MPGRGSEWMSQRLRPCAQSGHENGLPDQPAVGLRPDVRLEVLAQATWKARNLEAGCPTSRTRLTLPPVLGRAPAGPPAGTSGSCLWQRRSLGGPRARRAARAAAAARAPRAGGRPAAAPTAAASAAIPRRSRAPGPRGPPARCTPNRLLRRWQGGRPFRPPRRRGNRGAGRPAFL
jgi:hypothetical protein